MQVDETKTKPKSLWSHLYQQVEEQSDSCDVTVQVGSWKRKFHWCVLSASPFFVRLYESHFQEQQTGLIKLNIGTSNSVQTAIHFLYGQCPKITLDNLVDILEVSEFLMIEELKAMCIKRLKCVTINLENCIEILSVATRFEVYLENVSDFILSHLPDLLSNDEMLLLDKESVRFILTDQMLMYVSRKDCFRFLIKWISHCPGRKSDFAELFACLNKDDLEEDALETVNLNCLTESDRSLCLNISGWPDRHHDVLAVFPPIYSSGNYFIYAYNTRKKSWCQIKLQDNFYWGNKVRATLERPHTILHLKDGGQKIGFFNLVTQNKLEKEVEMTGNAEVPDLQHLTVSDANKYCVCNFTHADKCSTGEDNRLKLMTSLYAMPELYDFDDVSLLPLLVALSEPWRKRMNAASLYISEKEDNTEISLKPLITVRGSVQSICVTDEAVCLLIPERQQLIVYAERQHRVTEFDLSIYKLNENSYVCPCSKGGLYVVSQMHILQIGIRINHSDIIVNVSEIELEKKDDSNDWQYQAYPTRLEVLQDKVMAVTQCSERHVNQVWYQGLPENIKDLHKEEKFEIEVPEPLKYLSDFHFLQINLPKENLRCPIDCPHCNYKDTTRPRYYDCGKDNYFKEEIYYY